MRRATSRSGSTRRSATAPTPSSSISRTVCRSTVGRRHGRTWSRRCGGGRRGSASAETRISGRSPGSAGIRLPKVRSPDEARRVCARVSVPVICAIESGEGLEAAEAIASVPGVLTLSLGSRDLCADLGCDDTEETLRPVRERLASVCAVGPVDSVYYGRDEAGLRAAADSARRVGFSGKSTLWPEQVAAINAAFG
jgi:citrate lyase subunit beta / citryl-CoA lyase